MNTACPQDALFSLDFVFEGLWIVQRFSECTSRKIGGTLGYQKAQSCFPRPRYKSRVKSSQVKFSPKITVKRDVTNWKGRFETGPVTEAGTQFFKSIHFAECAQAPSRQPRKLVNTTPTLPSLITIIPDGIGITSFATHPHQH